tara:strand:- start:1241 stop:1852 length:612 start_codon:yes stop_codon:yes gene_type:complete
LKEIVIVDYGLGNIGSLLNMFENIGVQARISTDANDIIDAEKLVLPGVGAFDYAMEKLEEKKLIEILNFKVVETSSPILGVCLGMQLMCRRSEEGTNPGLGWVEGDVKRIASKPGLVIPHMGWNYVKQTRVSPLTQELYSDSRFYFVHSFYVDLVTKTDEILSCEYESEFTCGFQVGNIYGVQFHPEKSHRFGKQLLTNFAAL